MALHHTTRRRVCAWMIGVFLLMQWLVVAHACPQLARVQAGGSAAAAVASHAGDCHGGEPSRDTALCQAHCSVDQQAPAKAAPSDLPLPALGGFVLAFPAVPVVPAGLVDAGASGSPATAVCAGAAPGWPPLYLTLGVLRN